MKHLDEEVDPERERPEFYAIKVHLLDCGPGNYEHPKGEPASFITIGRKHVIEPLVLNMGDTRRLATRLLVSLATYDDEFAQKLLDDHFGYDDEGRFHWPSSPAPQWLLLIQLPHKVHHSVGGTRPLDAGARMDDE